MWPDAACAWHSSADGEYPGSESCNWSGPTLYCLECQRRSYPLDVMLALSERRERMGLFCCREFQYVESLAEVLPLPDGVT